MQEEESKDMIDVQGLVCALTVVLLKDSQSKTKVYPLAPKLTGLVGCVTSRKNDATLMSCLELWAIGQAVLERFPRGFKTRVRSFFKTPSTRLDDVLRSSLTASRHSAP